MWYLLIEMVSDWACFQDDMAYEDFQDLPRRATSDEVLQDKAFNIAKNPKYEKYMNGVVADFRGCWSGWVQTKALFKSRLTNKSLYTLKFFIRTDIYEALTWATLVIHWLTNPEASHLLTAYVLCNHHLAVLLYLKLPFEVRSNYCSCRRLR